MNILLLNYSPTYRLKSKGPACLLKISAKKTLLDEQIKILKKNFNNPNILTVTGFKHKKIKTVLDTYNIPTVENEFYEDTNCLYNVGLAINQGFINKSLLVIPGNLRFKDAFFKNFNSEESQLILTKQNQELGCTINDNKVNNVMWTLPNFWTNVVYFCNKEFELLEEIIHFKQNINKLYLFEAINMIINNGGEFIPVLKNSQIKYINKANDVDK